MTPVLSPLVRKTEVHDGVYLAQILLGWFVSVLCRWSIWHYPPRVISSLEPCPAFGPGSFKPQFMADIPGSVKDPNNPQWGVRRIVYNPILGVTYDCPESNW